MDPKQQEYDSLIGQRDSSPLIVVVDDFLQNPDMLRSFALKLQYREDLRYFRGQRSTTRYLSDALKLRFERLLGKKITKWREHEANGVFQFCIGGNQQVFHSDSQQYAAVLYLTPDAPPEGGTWLLRSKETGLRVVTEATAREIQLDVNQAMLLTYEGKLLDPTAWYIVDSIGNVYNRLVLWDAHYIHAAGEYFGNTINNGRLFQIFFFDAE
jgi:hypothetical protein